MEEYHIIITIICFSKHLNTNRNAICETINSCNWSIYKVS